MFLVSALSWDDTADKILLSKSHGTHSILDEIPLDPDAIYDVGLDQSLSCSGVYIESIDSKQHTILELINENLDSSNYQRVMLSSVKRLLRRIKVRYLVMEDPLGYASGRRNPKLTKLKHAIINMVEDPRSRFSITHFDKIQPQVWRAGLLPKGTHFYKNGNGEEVHLDRRTKRATAYTIMNRMPMSRKFLSLCHNPTDDSGFDGYDACGVLIGYKIRHQVTNDSTITKILGSKTSNVKVNCIFFPCRVEQDKVQLNQVLSFLESKEGGNLGEPVVNYYNEEESVIANAKMALTGNNRFVVTCISDKKAIASLMIRFNWKGLLIPSLYMIVIPKNKIRQKVRDLLEDPSSGLFIETFN